MVEAEFTAVDAEFDLVGLEIHEVALAIAHIGAAGADAFTPGIIIEPAVEFHIGAAQTHALAVDAGEVGFAADACAEAGVEGVIPNVQLPGVWRVDHGHEIDRWYQLAIRPRDLVGDVDDVFAGTDAIEGRHDVVWQFIRGGWKSEFVCLSACGIAFSKRLQAPAAVSGAGERSLFLCPFQRVEAQRGPVRGGVAAGIHLLLEFQEAEMAALVTAEAADLDIITQQEGEARFLVFGAGEELLLIIKTRSPGEVGADF